MDIITAKDILSKDFSKIREDESLSKALGKFRKTSLKPYAMVVIDNKGKYRGVITEREIIRSFLDPEKTKISGLLRRQLKRAPSISLETPLNEVTRLILEHDLKYLPIFENGKVKGIVRDIDILKEIVEKEFGNEPIAKFIAREPYILSPKDPVSSAIKLFREKNISRAPVTEKGSVSGILTMHDIITKLYMPKSKETKGEFKGEKLRYINAPIEGIMAKPAITCSLNSKVREIVELMLKNSITALVATDQAGRLEGIITKKDLLKPIAEMVPPKKQKFFISVSGELERLNPADKEIISKDINLFVEHFDYRFDEGHLQVNIKIHKERTRGVPMIYCKANFVTDKGKFSSSDYGWGAQNALQNTLHGLEKQIIKKGEKAAEERKKSKKRAFKLIG